MFNADGSISNNEIKRVGIIVRDAIDAKGVRAFHSENGAAIMIQVGWAKRMFSNKPISASFCVPCGVDRKKIIKIIEMLSLQMKPK